MNRRAKHQDTALERLPDPGHAAPWEMLAFLRRYPDTVPRDVQRADASDALILCARLWWDQRQEERTWLRRGRRLGLFLAVLGAPLGVRKQAVIDRLDRHDALLGDTGTDRPNEKVARESRRDQRERDAAAGAQQEWLDQHTDDLRELVYELNRQAERFKLDESDTEWLHEAVRDADSDRFTPASMTVVSLACDDVAASEPITALTSARPYKVHETLERLARLRSAFATARYNQLINR